MLMRIRALIIVTSAALTITHLAGCAPTGEGMKNRAAANDRMNLVGAQVNFEQAKQLFASGQLDKSLREIDKAIARFPKAGEYHLLRGRILLEQARLEQALEAFTLAIEKSTTPETEASAQPKATPDEMDKFRMATAAEAQYFAGVVYQRWSDDEQAFHCYSEAFRLGPDKVHYLMAAAESLVALGELQQADDLITPKMAYFEHNAGLRQLQAQIAMLRGDAKRSAEIYAEARMLNPDDTSLLEEMIWVQYAAGMYAQCYETAKTLCVTTGVERPDLMHLQARCLAIMGRGVEAREIYISLTKSRAADPAVWSELGTLAWELGDYRSLAQASVQLMAIAPERYEGYLFRAANEKHKGNNEEALRLLRESCRRAGGSTLPFLMLGQTLEQTGDFSGARTAYNAALAADPQSSEAITFLRRLNGEQQITAAPDQ